ncbi:MAG TPA: GTP 3',8-cyclase MoaA [Azospira sp.]|nr:GTP 3',8-cyclase MoaA [Azospira sp.]
MPGIVPAHGPSPLQDGHGRRITYLRLSLTDRCDFRCTYCMAEEMTFLPRHQVMSLEECLRLSRLFVGLGVTKLRITGGEPLVRRDALWLLERLAAMEGLKELVLTTNGSQLERFAGPLARAGVQRINISLDSLQPERFKAITRIGDLHKVLRGIAAAQSAGFKRLKLNTVMMRGVNDDELENLVAFAVDQGLDIAFIEEMPLGDLGHGRSGTYFSSDEALLRLQQRFSLLPSTESTGGPARYWRVANSDTRVGFISPHSHNFCDTCNRVRVTATGELYPCLGQNDATALLPLLRRHPEDDEPARQAILHTLGIKPLGHDFTQQLDAPRVVRFMSVTGG